MISFEHTGLPMEPVLALGLLICGKSFAFACVPFAAAVSCCCGTGSAGRY